MQEPLPMTIEPPAPGAKPRRPTRRMGKEWRIDAHTRRTGLAGLARARAALEATRTMGRRHAA